MGRALLALVALSFACAPAAPSAGATLGVPEGQVTLVRWFTDGCPHCAASLPALEELRATYADAGLATLAVYHPKPPRETTAAEAEGHARDLGYGGPVATDGGWSKLQRLLPEAGRSRPTSASLLIDGAGAVRWSHPGPRLHASDEDPAAEEAWAGARAAIEALLGDG